MPSAGDTLGLGQLGKAAGGNGDVTSTTRLAADCAGTTSGGPVSLSQFYISSIDSISLADMGSYDSAIATVQFSGAGSRFSRIKTQSTNFTWSEEYYGSWFNIHAPKHYQATITTGGPPTARAAQVGVRCSDYFNTHAGNYGTLIVEVFIIDSELLP